MNSRRRISAPKLRGQHCIGSDGYCDRAQTRHQNHCCSAQPMSEMGQKHTLPHCNSNGRFSSISGHTKAALIAPSKRDPPAFCRVGIVPGFGSNRSHMAANRLALAFKAALPRGCPDAFPASWRPAARPWCAPRSSPARAEAARMWIVNLLACLARSGPQRWCAGTWRQLAGPPPNDRQQAAWRAALPSIAFMACLRA
jgi:hypothetical protein